MRRRPAPGERGCRFTEALRAGKQEVISATEAATMILRVGDVIASKSTTPGGNGKGGAGGPGGMGGGDSHDFD